MNQGHKMRSTSNAKVSTFDSHVPNANSVVPFKPETSSLYADRLKTSQLLSAFGRALKRTLDITLSLPIVLFILPPLCILCRVIHLTQSSGPLFYRQVRCGQNGIPFTIFKFRTMSVPGEGACEIKEAETRIFPLGKFLRATKIDEIPQFLNVLRGSMSVVGPRPHHFEDCKLFEESVPDYRHRSMAKPGITGLSQYEEYCGRFRWNCTESRVASDLQYIREWTPTTDIQLIAKTGFVVLGRMLATAIRRPAARPAIQPLRVVSEHPVPTLNSIAEEATDFTDRKAA